MFGLEGLISQQPKTHKLPCYRLVPVVRLFSYPLRMWPFEVPGPVPGARDGSQRKVSIHLSTSLRPASSFRVSSWPLKSKVRFPKAYKILQSSHTISLHTGHSDFQFHLHFQPLAFPLNFLQAPLYIETRCFILINSFRYIQWEIFQVTWFVMLPEFKISLCFDPQSLGFSSYRFCPFCCGQWSLQRGPMLPPLAVYIWFVLWLMHNRQ